MPHWRLLREHLKREGPMTKEQVVKMLNIVSEILSKEQNMLIVKEPVCVVGDIHG
jgi:serine/threonine-protein phosphatase 2B catalytic subunit